MKYKLKLTETAVNTILVALSNDYADNDLQSRKNISKTIKIIREQVTKGVNNG